VRTIYAGLSGFVIALILIAAASCAPRTMETISPEWQDIGGIWERRMPNGVTCYMRYQGSAPLSCVRD
jgi:hypothetical protein